MADNNPLSQELLKFHTSSPTKKSDPAYGAIVAKKLLDTITGSANNYYYARNRKFADLRRIAEGNADMKEFLDLMNIDGKQAFAKIDMTPPKILPKFIDIVVERFMEMEERPTVKAVDDRSKKQKQRDMDEAEFVMNNSMMIQGLEEEVGLPLVDPQQYVPESYEDFALYFDYEYKQPEEIRFQRKIRDTLADSDSESIKRQVLYDHAIVGFGAMWVYKDANGNKKYKRLIPENVVYGWSNKDNFSDCTLIGEIEKMKVSDVRSYWPNLTEKKLYEMWKGTDQGSKVSLDWSNDFQLSLIRPYDDALIEIFHFQLTTTESHMWVEKKDKYGKPVLDAKKERPQRLGEDKVLHAKELGVIYSGCYSKSTNEILEWKKQENMIKPHYALHEVFSNYVLHMTNNRDMNNVSLVERAITPVRMMTLTLMKLQQIVAKLRPDGYAVDIRGLHGVNLGLGQDEFASPMQLVSIADQTGVVIYNGIGEDGETRQNIPITPITNDSNVNKITALVEQYNHWLSRLRDDLGVNEYVEGQAVNPKLGLGVMQSQVAASNRSTNFIYRAYLSMMKEVSKRIAIMDWYDVVENGDDRYGIKAEDFEDRIFDINFDMAPTDQDRQYIEQMAQTALSAGLITFEEAVKIRRIAKEDVKLAEIYLGKYESKRKRQMQDEANQNSQTQAQIQNQVAQNKAQADAQAYQLKGQIDIAKQDKVNAGTNTQVLGTIINTTIAELLKQGKGIQDMPEELKPIFAAFMQNMGITQQAQAQMQMQEQQAQAQAEQQAMEEQNQEPDQEQQMSM